MNLVLFLELTINGSHRFLFVFNGYKMHIFMSSKSDLITMKKRIKINGKTASVSMVLMVPRHDAYNYAKHF